MVVDYVDNNFFNPTLGKVACTLSDLPYQIRGTKDRELARFNNVQIIEGLELKYYTPGYC